jgi:hypothetical protein
MALALQAAGLAKVVSEGAAAPHGGAERIVVDLGEGLRAWVRTGDLLFPGAGARLPRGEAGEQVAWTGKSADEDGEGARAPRRGAEVTDSMNPASVAAGLLGSTSEIL